MKCYVFPGQGAQFVGMGQALIQGDHGTSSLLSAADTILGFSLSSIMMTGTEEDLKQTRVTQPAIFVHSVIRALHLGESFKPDAVAGHSLGEFSALTAAGALSFEDGLRLVRERALAMQDACDQIPGTMAAILGLDDAIIEDICARIPDVVVPANYNTPGQLVISGSITGVEAAVTLLSEAGAKRAVLLQVGGAFHSPLMEPARERLAHIIEETPLRAPSCPVYQNVNALPTTDPAEIKANLIAQLTAPVRWAQTIRNMVADGAHSFTEVGGKGNILRGMIRKMEPSIEVNAL
jgi:[acyl-carrier-protein] S-malonyltransferase